LDGAERCGASATLAAAKLVPTYRSLDGVRGVGQTSATEMQRAGKMKKTYERPVLIKREKLSSVTAALPLSQQS
jgi:hypothetical protein